MSKREVIAEVDSWGLCLGTPESVGMEWGAGATLTRAIWDTDLGELSVAKYANSKSDYFEVRIAGEHKASATADSAKAALGKVMRLLGRRAEFLAENSTTILSAMEGE